MIIGKIAGHWRIWNFQIVAFVYRAAAVKQTVTKLLPADIKLKKSKTNLPWCGFMALFRF